MPRAFLSYIAYICDEQTGISQPIEARTHYVVQAPPQGSPGRVYLLILEYGITMIPTEHKQLPLSITAGEIYPLSP